MVKWFLPLLLVGCVTEGNEISGSWMEADGGGPLAGEGKCIGDVRVTVHALGETTTDRVSCDDGGFSVVVPYEATRAKVELQDDWSDIVVFDLEVDGNIDLGRVWFYHL